MHLPPHPSVTPLGSLQCATYCELLPKALLCCWERSGEKRTAHAQQTDIHFGGTVAGELNHLERAWWHLMKPKVQMPRGCTDLTLLCMHAHLSPKESRSVLNGILPNSTDYQQAWLCGSMTDTLWFSCVVGWQMAMNNCWEKLQGNSIHFTHAVKC